MQPVNMGDQFLFTGPPTEIEAQHLIGAFGGCPPDPQTNQQPGVPGVIRGKFTVRKRTTKSLSITKYDYI